MKMFLKRVREQVPTFIGAALLTLVLDGFILVYRLIGLSRAVAVYAGLFTFAALGGLQTQRLLKRIQSTRKKEGHDA